VRTDSPCPALGTLSELRVLSRGPLPELARLTESLVGRSASRLERQELGGLVYERWTAPICADPEMAGFQSADYAGPKAL
jgi:hypothetical protein